MKSSIVKWLVGLILFAAVVFSLYLFHLHKIVVNKFSQPIDKSNSQLSLDEYPKALKNMLLI